MVNNRVVSVELPLSDGQTPIYNSTTDKFTPGTATSSAAVINGTSVFTAPTATGSLSLVGGQAATDNSNGDAIVLGPNAATTNGVTVTIGYFASTAGIDDVAIGFGATTNLGGGSPIASICLGNGSTNAQASTCIGAASVSGTLSTGIGRNCSVTTNALSCIAIGAFTTIGNFSTDCRYSIALGYQSRVLRMLGTNMAFSNGEPTVTGQTCIVPGFNSNGNFRTALGMLQLGGTGTNAVTSVTFNLALFDGTTNITTPDTSINNPNAGLFVLEGFVNATPTGHGHIYKAWSITYYYDSAHGATPYTLGSVSSSTFSTDNTTSANWNLGLSVNGSGVFTLNFNAGATGGGAVGTGTFSAYALLRFI
jgi:hypothetical protein